MSSFLRLTDGQDFAEPLCKAGALLVFVRHFRPRTGEETEGFEAVFIGSGAAAVILAMGAGKTAEKAIGE